MFFFNLDDEHQNKSNMSLKEIESAENIKILSKNTNSLLKLICSDSCEGLNITTVSLNYLIFNKFC